MHTADIVTVSLAAAFLIVSAMLHLKPRLLLITALLLMGVSGIAFALGKDDLADQLAFSVFYLLIGGSVMLILEHVKKRPPRQ